MDGAGEMAEMAEGKIDFFAEELFGSGDSSVGVEAVRALALEPLGLAVLGEGCGCRLNLPSE